MKILLVEDDDIQEEAIVAAIRKTFPQIEMECLRTEFEFRQKLEQLAPTPPNLIILDVMIRWTDPSPEMEPQPEDVKIGEYYRAGIRCEKLLRNRAETAGIPVIIYSILESADLDRELPPEDGRVSYVSKGSDTKPLLDKIKSHLSN